jgi:acetyl esterase/lipase
MSSIKVRLLIAGACVAGMLAGAGLTAPTPATGPSASPKAHSGAFGKKTLTFKTVDGLELKADVHRTDNGKIQPVVVWFHGGGLTSGDRKWPRGDVRDLCKRQGYILISFDYRLAPEVKLPEIIADVKDGFRWIREKGPALFQADPTRIVVAGSSAGGYLTLMTGICIEPRPVALVSYWGYGDIDGDWVSKPGEYYRKRFGLVSREAAMKAYGEVTTGEGWSDQKYAQRKTYARYLRQNGLWTQEVSGFDPATEPRKLDPYCPVRNVTAKYPPTFHVHGTDDTDVPVSKAEDMARELKRAGVAHELILIPKAGHRLNGGDKKLVANASQRALKWITDHIEKDAGK